MIPVRRAPDTSSWAGTSADVTALVGVQLREGIRALTWMLRSGEGWERVRCEGGGGKKSVKTEKREEDSSGDRGTGTGGTGSSVISVNLWETPRREGVYI